MTTKRPAAGTGLFYTRDSAGRSELAPPQYVAWALAEAARLGVQLEGTAQDMAAMIADGVPARGGLFVDYGVSGNVLSRPGFDAFRSRALADTSVSHLFVPRRDRIARPDNPLDAMEIEYELRAAGLTLVLMSHPPLPPLQRGSRIQIADLLTSLLDYDSSGRFRRDLAEKLIHAKLQLARMGFSIGGDAPYGFRRWLCTNGGERVRELRRNEIVKMPGHHVVWLPTAEAELAVVRRIFELIESTPASRIAQMLNAEGVPSPQAGRERTVAGVKLPISGEWAQNTVKNIVKHPLYAAVCEYGKRAEGDQMRLTPAGPRPLSDADFRTDGRPRTVSNPQEGRITVPARFEPVVSPDRQAQAVRELERRGAHLRNKARARGDAPNPLGGLVFDLNCGWPMYRYQRRGRWCYGCALYQNSEAKVCSHNVVGGPEATRFVLGCLRQRVLAPSAMQKLRARLEELAAAERGEGAGRRQQEADQKALEAVKKKLATVGRNMALAETPEERAMTAAVFGELKAEEARLAQRVGQAASEPTPGPDRGVADALALLDRLGQLAEASGPTPAAVGELFRQTGAKLYLRFRETEHGRRMNVLAGGVLTFGSAPPPGPLYDGPTHRAIIKKALAEGRPVSPVLGHGAPEPPVPGAEAAWSANVQRGTRRCT